MNIGDYCNECGNCATFCPTSGAPYKDKAKFHVSAQSFASARIGYHFADGKRLAYKDNGRSARIDFTPEGYLYEDDDVKALLGEDYVVRKAELKGSGPGPVSLRHAVEMAILFQAARQLPALSPKEDG